MKMREDAAAMTDLAVIAAGDSRKRLGSTARPEIGADLFVGPYGVDQLAVFRYANPEA